jgi:hypothetical protein
VDTTGSTKSSSGSRRTGNTGTSTNKKKKLECGKAHMMVAQKAGSEHISSKNLRAEVKDVAFDESIYVGRPMGINQEEWENEELAEDTEELAG